MSGTVNKKVVIDCCVSSFFKKTESLRGFDVLKGRACPIGGGQLLPRTDGIRSKDN